MKVAGFGVVFFEEFLYYSLIFVFRSLSFLRILYFEYLCCDLLQEAMRCLLILHS